MIKKIIDEEKEKYIIQLCLDGASYRKISELVGASSTFIEKFCKKRNVFSKKSKSLKIDIETENKICKLYEDGYGSPKISKILEISKPLILKILHKNNIQFKKPGEHVRKHKFNENYFSNIDSSEKAYWLGFISGDGCIIKNFLTISLSIKDEAVINEFLKCINGENHKRYYSINENNSLRVKIDVHSRTMINDLKKHNISNRKSFTLKLSNNIPEIFLNHYILGLIDADGCFYFNKNRNALKFSLIGSKSSISSVQKILIKKCQLKRTKLYEVKRCKGIYVMEYGGHKQLQRLFNFLYKDVNFCLERKRQKALLCFNYKNYYPVINP